jgi:hypothetical protein
MGIISPSVWKKASRVLVIAKRHDISLTQDNALDIVEHLSCDHFNAFMDSPPEDWHCVFWAPDLPIDDVTDPSLARSQTEAVAGAMSRLSEMEPLDLARDGQEIIVASDDGECARIRKTPFLDPDETTLQRIQSLVAPLKTWDEQALVRELSQLKSWHIESGRSLSSLLYHRDGLTELRKGEWLPPVWLDRPQDKAMPAEALRPLREEAREQNQLPMWATPNTLARLFQRLLEQYGGVRLKLATCQEELAHVFGVDSWQILLSKFRSHTYLLQSTRLFAPEPEFHFFRGPLEMLAWTYDEAKRYERHGTRLHLQVDWTNGYRLGLTQRLISIAKLYDRVSAAAGEPYPPHASLQSALETEARWDNVEIPLRAEAEEWHCSHFPNDVLYPDQELIERAKRELDELE